MNRRRSTAIVFALWALGVGLATLVLMACPAGVGADSGGGGAGGKPETPADPDYAAGMKAVDGKQYAAAIPLFEKVIARDGNNADAYNMLAYATRKNGDPAKAIPIYEKALTIDPKHRGAHEYIGEAYLQLDNLPKAKEHLARLDKLCFLPCEQYSDLKKAVEVYEKSGGKIKPVASQ